VRALRARQQRNVLLLLLTSHGIPMLLAGDEIARTQHGNNNAYCQDGPDYWFDWSTVESNMDLLRFVREAIALRRAHPALRRRDHPDGHTHGRVFPGVSWHGVHSWTPDWSAHSRLLATMLYTRQDGVDDCVYVAANSYWEEQSLELPELPAEWSWRCCADTCAPPPQDIHSPGAEPVLVDQTRVRVGPRSVLVLTAKSGHPINRGDI
jgi:glycogen operon protein